MVEGQDLSSHLPQLLPTLKYNCTHPFTDQGFSYLKNKYSKLPAKYTKKHLIFVRDARQALLKINHILLVLLFVAVPRVGLGKETIQLTFCQWSSHKGGKASSKQAITFQRLNNRTTTNMGNGQMKVELVWCWEYFLSLYRNLLFGSDSGIGTKKWNNTKHFLPCSCNKGGKAGSRKSFPKKSITFQCRWQNNGKASAELKWKNLSNNMSWHVIIHWSHIAHRGFLQIVWLSKCTIHNLFLLPENSTIQKHVYNSKLPQSNFVNYSLPRSARFYHIIDVKATITIMEYFLGHGQPKLPGKLVLGGQITPSAKNSHHRLESSSRDKFQTLSCLPALSKCGLCGNHKRKVLKTPGLSFQYKLWLMLQNWVAINLKWKEVDVCKLWVLSS